MAEHADNNAFAAVISRLGELTESELRQLHLIIGVRIGIDPSAPAGKGGSSTGKTRGGAKEKGPGKSGAASKTSAGKKNPQRKSQWANHPLYQEYSRLKKVVETQSKEQKCSFNSVRTDEARAYREALSQWLEAKSHFRDRKTAENDSSDEESEDENAGPSTTVPSSTQGSEQSVLIPSPTSGAASGGKTAGASSSAAAGGTSPKGKGPALPAKAGKA